MTPLCSGPARRAQLISATSLLALVALLPTAQAQTSVAEIVEASSPAVVNVSVLFGSAPGDFGAKTVRVQRPGSGVVLSSGGLILTNSHLVAEATDAEGNPSDEFWAMVSFRRGLQYPATVVARDERLDLALLQIQAGSTLLPALPLADLEGRKAGERVLAMSLASTSDPDVFAGVLGFPGDPVQLRDALLQPNEVLLTDARFHASLDGGPLLDDKGRLLGLYNSSHVSTRPEGFDEDPDADPTKPKEPDTDYAVIVSVSAIKEAFGQELAASLEPLVHVKSEDEQEAVAVIEGIAPHVVSVWTGDAAQHPVVCSPADPPARLVPETLGSGVVIDARGLVLTSGDLFRAGGETASVRIASGETYAAKLLARRPLRKVALLQLELPEGVALSPALLADSRQALAGELVAVVGRPYSAATSSVGVLSSLERENFVQVASWVHPGHFGGAIADREGRLIGIATAQPESAGRVDEKSYLGFGAPLAETLEAFKAELAPFGQLAIVEDDDAGIEARRSVAAQVVDRTRGSLVNVLVSKAEEPKDNGFSPFGDDEKTFHLLGQGSGVVIDASGLALTNWHVVDAAMQKGGGQSEDALVEVTMPTGNRYVADVLSTSRDDDLALISLRLAPGETLEPVVLGDSDDLIVGQPVFAIGNPLGLANSVSAGIVSRLGMDVMISGRLRKYEGMVQTDAAINPGNSGGALLDEEGRLVGINSAGRTGAGMAIPVNTAREVFSDKLLSVEKLRTIYLGFEVAERDGALVVGELDPDSPATRASLELSDELLSVNGSPVASAIAFAQVRRSLSATEPLRLKIGRQGEEHELSLQPLSYAAWRIYQQSGLELSAVDYSTETELVRDASVALHRAYTGNSEGLPTQLMAGALRVERTQSLESEEENPVQPGDLLLGMSTRTRGAIADQYDLTRYESLATVGQTFDAIATKDGERAEFWVLRDGRIEALRVLVRRAPR